LLGNRTSEEIIAAALSKTCQDLRRRGYVLGLPAKWFKSAKRATDQPVLEAGRGGDAV
jgi:hypothetical protein